MGSASREALSQVKVVLDGLTGQAPLGFGRELFGAAASIAAAPALSSSLADPAATASSKQQLVAKLFGSLQDPARRVLDAVASARWSNAEELVDGVEEIGIRAEARAAENLADELEAVAAIIGSQHELELTLGSKLVAPAAKAELVTSLLKGKVSTSALALVAYFVANPRGRRLRTLLKQAAVTVADEGGSALATVTVAAPLDAARTERLRVALAASAGRPVKITTVIDPDLVGGVRIQIADTVIDGSVRARLDDLRLQLAG